MKKTPENLMYSNRELMRLVMPLIVELALKLIVGLLDSVMVSSVGEAAVSGVWVSMAVLDWGFRAAVYAVRWRSGKWMTKGILLAE